MTLIEAKIIAIKLSAAMEQTGHQTESSIMGAAIQRFGEDEVISLRCARCLRAFHWPVDEETFWNFAKPIKPCV